MITVEDEHYRSLSRESAPVGSLVRVGNRFALVLFIVFSAIPGVFGALFLIMALVVAVAVTMRMFAGISTKAARLLVPYLLWVLYATSLNAYVVWAN